MRTRYKYNTPTPGPRTSTITMEEPECGIVLPDLARRRAVRESSFSHEESRSWDLVRTIENCHQFGMGFNYHALETMFEDMLPEEDLEEMLEYPGLGKNPHHWGTREGEMGYSV